MTSRSSAYVTALSIAMVAGGLISLHIFRNLSAASASEPASAGGSHTPLAPKSSGPLYDAITDNDAPALARVLSSHPDLEQAAPSGAHAGLTPLQAAATLDRNEIVKALLTAGAKPDSAPQDGRTPLALAAAANHPDTIVMLAESGAAIDARDVHGRTPLMHAAAAGHAAAVQALLGAGASLNTADETGATALALAITTQSPTATVAVRSLLEAGANAEGLTPDGLTPLMLAAKTASAEKVITNLNAGANHGARARDGRTARDIARTRTDDEGKQISKILPE